MPPRAPGAPPRIALALSGGGARGIAHVGVLKVLEEMRIPIHCVTGTSMGSIVGGAFAVGTSPDDIEKMVLATNWDEIFRDKPPRDGNRDRGARLDDYKTLFAPEFGVKDGGLALPKGIIAGVSIEAFFRVRGRAGDRHQRLRQAADPVPRDGDRHRDRRSRRARATAASPQAMRASMSVPGAIAPVEIDGRLLVDGGIANNLPIDEARKLCARRGDRRQHLARRR